MWCVFYLFIFFAVLVCLFVFCMKNQRKKLCKMTTIETDCRFYDQTPRHVFIEENGVSCHMGISYLVRHWQGKLLFQHVYLNRLSVCNTRTFVPCVNMAIKDNMEFLNMHSLILTPLLSLSSIQSTKRLLLILSLVYLPNVPVAAECHWRMHAGWRAQPLYVVGPQAVQKLHTRG